MNARGWLWAYVGLFAVVMALAIIGIAQACPVFEDGYLGQGCDDSRDFTSWAAHALNWLLIAGVVSVVGMATTLLLRRRPTVWSVVVWLSAGFMEVALVAWYIEPGFLRTPLQVSIAVGAVLAVVAGVSLARRRQPAVDSISEGTPLVSGG